MKPFHEYMNEYKKQLRTGFVQKAYRGLMEYMLGLRTFFNNKYPDYFVSGSLYYGYMDMTYFSITPISLKQRKLKIAVVFIHETLRFEVWLGGYNKQVQQKYWKLIKESGWTKYHLVATTKGVDSILEHTIVDDADFSDLAAVTKKIETEAMKFIGDVESFLSMY